MTKIDLKPGQVVISLGYCVYCGQWETICRCGMPGWIGRSMEPDEPETAPPEKPKVEVAEAVSGANLSEGERWAAKYGKGDDSL